MPALTVYVAYKSGSSASGVRVSGAVSMGGMTKPVKTNKDGRAVVEWSSGNLSNLYINGKGYKNSFKGGETHTFQI